MYALINRYADVVVGRINPAGDVEPYVRLLDRLQEVDVTQDAEFQRTYRHYWRLNAARLGERFIAAYFSMLEDLKRTPATACVRSVAEGLYATPTHGDGRTSLQFSFATKLGHMLRPELPIYDSLVQGFYFFPDASRRKTFEERLACQMESYEFLRREYRRVMDEGLLAPAMALFRQRIALAEHYTDVKVIDTLIWKFSSFLNEGAILRGKVLYA